MIRHRSALLIATAGLVLAAAPPAAADDASLFNAYVARQASEVDPAAEAYLRATRRVGRADNAREARRAFRAVIRADKRINRALRHVEADLEAQQGSSDHGTRARTEGLKEVRGWRLANRLEIRVIRRILRGEDFNIRRALRRPNKIMRRVYRNGRRAVRHFGAVGLSHPVGAVSAK